MKSMNLSATLRVLGGIGFAILLVLSGRALAAPGDILFFDNFERSNPGVVGNGWVETAAAGACTGVPPVVTPAVFPAATFTVNTATTASVTGITVNGVQILSAATNASSNINTVAQRMAANITLNGYTATRTNNVVTITGPAIAAGFTPVVTFTGTMTYTVSAFSAYTPPVSTGGNTGCSGIDADTPPWNGTTLPLAPRANDNSRTMFTRWATVTVDSPVINLAGKAGAQITYWVRRGSDCFSEWPGNNMAGCNAVLAPFTSLLGEEFQTQYKNSAGTWVVLSQYPTDAIPGEIFRPVIDLPADAMWSGFQLRFRQPSGSGFGGNGGAPGVLGYDYWHVDDVKITELAATNSVGAFCDTFEGDPSRWTFTGTGNAAIGSTYFQNGLHDLDVRWGPVTVTSKPTDMTTATGNIQYWIKRGVGAVTTAPNTTGSDIPEAGENLVIEYLTTTAGVWAPLVPATTFVGGGTGGQVWTPAANPTTNSIAIPANANRAAFQLRFRLLAGSGYDQDYWHIDDVCLGTVVTGTDLSLTMTPTGTTTLAPGATSTITFTVTNNGPNVEPGNISIIDTLPAGLSFVSSGNWSSGSWPAGVTSCTTVGQDVTCTRVGTLAVGASTTLTITVQADPTATGTVTNSARVGGQSLETVPANNSATNSYSFAPSAFEAYETSTTVGALVGRIYTKIAGTPFSLRVIAKNAAGSAINTAYNKAATVDLIDGTLSCVAGTAALTGVTVVTSPYTYVAGDSGVHTFTFTSTTAYPNVKVRIRDNAAVGCSSDNFAIRPSAFTISSTNAGNNNATGTPTITAGAAFNLTASSVVGYNGTPVVDNTGGMILGSPNAGTLEGVFTAAPVGTGTAAGASFTYSEVGNFGLAANAVYDSTFTNVDQPGGDCVATAGLSFSNTLDASGRYGCSIGSIGVVQTTGSSGFGRFIPDHFDTVITQVAGVPMLCPTGLTCPAAYNGFVYSSQPFTLQVIAKNLAGATTLNYAGGYAHGVSLIALGAPGPGTLNTPTGAGSLGVTSGAAFVAGVLAEPAQKFTFTTIATAPTDVYVRATETASDGITSLRTVAANSIEGGVKVVSGRVKIANAHGSELLPLTLMATVQYYNGTAWVTSVTDSASSLTLAPTYPVLKKNGTSAGTTTPAPTGATTVSGGTKNIQLSKPTGGEGSASINPSAPVYLPVTPGLATFGVYKGSNEFIYLREAY